MALVLLGSCDAARISQPSQAVAGPVRSPERLLARYIGTLPCANCPGIRTDLQLYASDARATHYSLLQTYLDASGGNRAQEDRGRWALARDPAAGTGAAVIQLDSSQSTHQVKFLRADENRLRLLDDTRVMLHRIMAARETAALDIGPGDAITPVEVNVGQALRIHLPASPATGYRWMLEEGPPSFLHMETDPGAELADSRPSRTKSKGMLTWHFRAGQAGRATLRFAYRRPWEAMVAPVQSAVFEVNFR